MTLTSQQRDRGLARGFSHEVVFYDGLAGLSSSVLPFLLEGVERDEPVLVVMLPDRLEVLKRGMGALAGRVEWLDMSAVGTNPARIIPAWHTFLETHGGAGPVRGVGEPIWAERRDAEMAEAELHESLLNLAFDDGPAWRLLCPYDLHALTTPVLDEAMRNHPVRDGENGPIAYAGHEHARRTFAEPLPPAPDDAIRLDFGVRDLAMVRDVVRRAGDAAHLHPSAADDLVLAAHELAANSVQHAGGGGSVLVWAAPGALDVEVRDDGVITDPLVGRGRLNLASEHGRGVWMANQLCDLVQVRSGAHGTQVRLHAWL